MTPEEIEAIERIEKRLELPGIHLPKTEAELRWLCALARRLATTVPGKPKRRPRREEHEIALANQAHRIAVLERKLGLTPDVVLAEERKRLEAEL